MSDRVLRIEAPHFVAGVGFKEFMQGEFVSHAAPIVRYMMGWTEAKVREYCASKGWKVDSV